MMLCNKHLNDHTIADVNQKQKSSHVQNFSCTIDTGSSPERVNVNEMYRGDSKFIDLRDWQEWHREQGIIVLETFMRS